MTDDLQKEFVSRCEEDTARVAQWLAGQMRGGEYVSLEGDLGAGKTLFARAFARALGIEGAVTSPTFVLQKVYEVRGNAAGVTELAHYDFYRIGDYGELIDMGFEDHDAGTVVLAEWGDLFVEEFARRAIRVRFVVVDDEVRRVVVVMPTTTS